MFHLDQPTNPLTLLAAHTGTNLVQNQLAKNEESKLQKLLSGLGPESSDLDFVKVGMSLPKEHREPFFKAHETISKGRQEKTKQQKEDSDKREKQARGSKLAKAYGISQEEAEGLEPSEIAALGKNRNKKERASDISIDPQQMQIIKNERGNPGFDELDEVGQYRALTDAGVSSANAKTEAGLKTDQLNRLNATADKSYEREKQFIEDTTSSYKAFETDTKPKLLQMQSIPKEQLVAPGAAAFLEAVGLPLGLLEDPSSELYSKLSLDLLKGLPETYGNRILKVEVDNFLRTIPALINSPDGRRMIASNILKLGEMKEAYYKEMRNQQLSALDQSKPYPKDFQQRIFDNVKPQLDRINNEFVQLSQLTSVPEGKVPFFNPQGTISFVDDDPKAVQWASQNGGKRIW